MMITHLEWPNRKAQKDCELYDANVIMYNLQDVEVGVKQHLRQSSISYVELEKYN